MGKHVGSSVLLEFCNEIVNGEFIGTFLQKKVIEAYS